MIIDGLLSSLDTPFVQYSKSNLTHGLHDLRKIYIREISSRSQQLINNFDHTRNNVNEDLISL